MIKSFRYVFFTDYGDLGTVILEALTVIVTTKSLPSLTR